MALMVLGLALILLGRACRAHADWLLSGGTPEVTDARRRTTVRRGAAAAVIAGGVLLLTGAATWLAP